VRTGFDSRLVPLLPVSIGFDSRLELLLLLPVPVSPSDVSDGLGRGLWIRTRFLNNSFLLSRSLDFSSCSSALRVFCLLDFLAPGTNLLLVGVLTLEFKILIASNGEDDAPGLRNL